MKSSAQNPHNNPHAHITSRANERRGGGLSNNTIKKLVRFVVEKEEASSAAGPDAKVVKP